VSDLLSEIPVAGKVLGPLVEILWPGSDPTNQVWENIEARVEALIDEKIDAEVFARAQADLTGLQAVLARYTGNARPGHTPTETWQAWSNARSSFEQRMPSLSTAGSEVLLLPLWAQAAGMHLLLLRDGYLFGTTWGMNAADLDDVLTELRGTLADYTAWAPRTFGRGLTQQMSAAGVNHHACQPFRATNAYHREMVPQVLDLAQRWPLLDPTVVPGKATPEQLYLTSEIYSDPFGTADDSGLFLLPWQHPTAPPAQITVWSGSLIDAVQVTYPGGAGPDGVTQTARMGGRGGTATTITIRPDNPIATVDVWAGDVVEGLQFTFADGSTSARLGGTGGTRTTVSFPGGVTEVDGDEVPIPGRALSSIYINGVSAFYGTTDAIVFGFRYPPPAAGSDAERSAGHRAGRRR